LTASPGKPPELDNLSLVTNGYLVCGDREVRITEY
jgi:hypothetical protein